MSRMVLKVPPDAGEMLYNRNSEALQFRLIAATRLHQNLRSVNRTKRQHYLEVRADAMGFAVVENLHPAGPLAFEGQPGDQCLRENSQVRPVHIWKGIRT